MTPRKPRSRKPAPTAAVAVPASPVDALKSPEYYSNRELALLEFNRRVLAQARDLSVPPLERLRFLAISCSNLDEFFEIRVSGLREQVAYDVVEAGPDGATPRQTLDRVSAEAHRLVDEQYRVLNEELLPELDRYGIRLLPRRVWTPAIRRWAQRFFRESLLPLLTPIGLDPAHPFPRIVNKSLNFIISLDGKDAFGRTSRLAVVQAPRTLPRLIPVPAGVAASPHEFVTLSAIIHEEVGEIFPGMKVLGCRPFRVTRNSDLWVDEEDVDDLLRALKGELSHRHFGDAVRLEIRSGADDPAQFLLQQFELGPADLYRVEGPVNLHRLMEICDRVERPELKYPRFVPGPPARREPEGSLFDEIRAGDLLLHHPYQSAAPVLELIRTAATDPAVLAIKMTLYRTGKDSPYVAALLDAARLGKEVTAVVELRARFDEEENIDFATRLQEAGAKVAYGVVGYKAHAKMALVVRQEGDRLRRYVHLGTGNYHMGNSRAYTDFGLLTADEALGEDVQRLFQQLTGLGRMGKMSKLLEAPFNFHRTMIALVEAETEAAKRGEPARIVAKMNALTESKMIRALYRASQAGVAVDLVVRGVCCLRPGIPGISENIRVRSVVGRFLEHSRVFHFHAGGEGKTYLASADWMDRNFYRRVETCFPVEDPQLKRRVIDEALTTYLSDNVQAWLLQPDGTYRRATPGAGSEPFVVQERLMAKLGASTSLGA